MTNNKKGFTLLELLIAATIIGILAVLATVSYRNSAADTRVAGAKARLEMLANAVQRYKLDPSVCPEITSTAQITVANLMKCGYLESGFGMDELFDFQICNGSASLCGGTSDFACMAGKSTAKLPRHYWSASGYRYCVNSNGVATETPGA